MNELLRSETHARFKLLLAALADVFSSEGRPGAELAATRLRRAASRVFVGRTSQLKPQRLLEKACRLPGAVDWANLVLECAPLLDWEQWEGSGLSREISSRLFTTELLGPDGHVHDNDVRVGLLISEPHTDYPISSHSGEETYFVISGEADWVLGDGDYQRYPPGSLIHHPSWEKHGRCTLSEPFLGAWRWSGDLNLSTFSVSE